MCRNLLLRAGRSDRITCLRLPFMARYQMCRNVYALSVITEKGRASDIAKVAI